MRTLVVAVALLAASPAAAQREVTVSGVRIEMRNPDCVPSAEQPCDEIRNAELQVRTGDAPVRVRVVSVEIMPDPSDGATGTWTRATDLHVMRDVDRVRTEPPHRRHPVLRFRAHEEDRVLVTFAPVAAPAGRVRVTLAVGNRRAVLEARRAVPVRAPASPGRIFRCGPGARCEIQPGVVGMAAAEVFRHLGAPSSDEGGVLVFRFPRSRCVDVRTVVRLVLDGDRVREATVERRPTGIHCW